MWEVIAAIVAAATLGLAVMAAAGIRRRPPGLVLPIGLAIYVGFEAVLACALSPAGFLTRPGVLAAHGACLAVAAPLLLRQARIRAWLRRLPTMPGRLARRDALLVMAALVPLAALLAFVAAVYPPSNWDTMTFRLARVAHWIQHRSVAPYPTHIDRQIASSPGAEYVLVTWQLMSGSDRLASFLQLGAWLVVSVAAAPLARLAGAGRRLAGLAVVLVATVPMGILQATSTQNDLVASAAAIGAVAATLPFFRHRPRPRAIDGATLGGTLAVAYLVKPTAIAVAAPFLAMAAGSMLRALRDGRFRARAMPALALAATLAAAVVAGPDAALRLRDEPVRAAMRLHAARFMFGPFDLSADRLANLGQGLARHFPAPAPLRARLGMDVPRGCSGGWLPCPGSESMVHEDVQGNPLHVLVMVALGAVAVARWRGVPARARWLAGSVAIAWLLFQLTFRGNPWLSRLETPLFALAPLGLGVLGGTRGAARRRLERAALAAAVLLVLAGWRTAIANRSRPALQDSPLKEPVAAYYANRPELRIPHDATLWMARARGCSRIGLFLGEDSYDYPLTWRAMQMGTETRHVQPGDPWPCLVFTDGSVSVPPTGAWHPLMAPFILENGAGGPGVPSHPPGVLPQSRPRPDGRDRP